MVQPSLNSSQYQQPVWDGPRSVAPRSVSTHYGLGDGRDHPQVTVGAARLGTGPPPAVFLQAGRPTNGTHSVVPPQTADGGSLLACLLAPRAITPTNSVCYPSTLHLSTETREAKGGCVKTSLWWPPAGVCPYTH